MNTLEQIAAAWLCGKHKWSEIGAFFGISGNAAGKRYRKEPVIPTTPCPICTLADSKGEISADFEVDGNYAVATSKDGRVRSLEDLLAASRVDLSVWKVRDDNSWGTKAFEGHAADEYKNLTFDDGKISGVVRRDGIVVETLFSVWASFVRINPEPLMPVVRPIEYSGVSFPNPPRPDPSSVKTSLILADTHIGYRINEYMTEMLPFHDRRAMDIAVQAAEMLQPDSIVVLGDLLDLAMFTDKFVRYTEFERATQPSLLEAFHFLLRLRKACPRSRIELHQGNHEKRMERIMLANMRYACKLKPADEMHLPPSMSVPRLLSLHELGIEWVGDYPDDISWMGDNLQVLHGSHASQTATSTIEKILKTSTVCKIVGHIHRIETAGRTFHTRNGGTIEVIGHCPGCLCNIGNGGPPAKTKFQNWQQGMTLVEYANDLLPTLNSIPILNGEAIVRGNRIVGQDSTAALKEKWPMYNW